MSKVKVFFTLIFLSQLRLETVSAESDYLEMAEPVACTFDNGGKVETGKSIFPIGFGQGRYFAWFNEQIIIFDLVKDAYVATIPAQRDGRRLELSPDAKKQLGKMGIKSSSTIKLETFPLLISGERFDVSHSRFFPGGPGHSLEHIKLDLHSDKKGKKPITEFEDESYSSESSVLGCFHEPGGDRIAIVLSMSSNEEAESQDRCGLSVFGAHLKLGFPGAPPNKSLKPTNPAQGNR